MTPRRAPGEKRERFGHAWKPCSAAAPLSERLTIERIRNLINSRHKFRQSRCGLLERTERISHQVMEESRGGASNSICGVFLFLALPSASVAE